MSAPIILDELRTATISDPAWVAAVGPALDDPHVGVHLAVMVEPFLSLILDGAKTIESRFSKNAIAPYQRVSDGDVVLLKAGPVVGSFQVSSTTYRVLDDGDLARLRTKYADAIGAHDDEFWAARADKRYATLLGVGAVHRLPPVLVSKRDMRGWVIVRQAATAEQPTLL
jgi:hypothetical protein